MKTILSRLLIVCSWLLTYNTVNAQCTTPNCYVRNNYVEVGVSVTGAFGACGTPTGYHPNVTQGCGISLGFVSDPDKDGWAVSSPGSAAYMGDYFVPGSPYEGWDLQYNGGAPLRYRNQPSGGTCPGSACANVAYSATGTEQTTVWEGTAGTLDITQKTVVRTDKLYFVMYVDIVNSGSATVNNIYYFRGLDPDNDQPWPLGGFATNNKIVFQPGALSKNCLATATGRGYPAQAYLGLGTKDCRARCCIFDGGFWPFSTNPSDVYNKTGVAAEVGATGNGFHYTVGTETIGRDNAIGLVFSLGSLAAGQKTSLAYTYILKQADLDSALGETSPKFESSGAPYSPYTTFRVCPGKTVPLKVVNGGQYTWIWTPGTDMAAAGSSTKIAAGGTIPTVTGSKVYPDGAVLGDSVVVTVWGPKTYTATGISNCDTQTLIFYVDTISFSVPPAVTTPIRYCEGETAAVLTAGAAPAATLNWYTTATGGTGSPTAPTPSTAFPSGSDADYDTTSYWVSQTNAAGCETPRAKIDVIITRKPTPPEVADLIYCLGDATDFLTATGVNLSWYDAASAGTKYTSTPQPSSSTAGTTSYFVSQKVNGCESDRSQLDVEISQVVASFDKSRDSLCGPELLSLTNNSITSSAGSYVSNWSFGDGASSADSNTEHSYDDMRGTYYVNLVVTNPNGCKDSTKQKVEVFKRPEMSLSASDTMICQGESVDFQGTATPGYRSLTWDFGDGDPAYNSLQVRHAYKKSGIFNVQIMGEYPACPGTGSGAIINVVPLPNINLGDDIVFCPGSQAFALFNKNTDPVEHYLWNTGDTTARLTISHEGDYTLTASNWRCYSADSIRVTKGCYLDIPSAFTPGSGGDYGSYFLPRDLFSQSVVTFHMQIFDRWGQLLFESDKTNGRGWDGTYKGQAMPMGVYVYLIKVSFVNGVTETYSGDLTLIR